jgi:transcriptional regulator GlxA family with amidase domain
MSAVITSIHDDPAHDWTVEELGQRAGMSRSTFALRFKETVGVSPMEYLTRWRMLLAGDRMANTSDSISEIHCGDGAVFLLRAMHRTQPQISQSIFDPEDRKLYDSPSQSLIADRRGA